jgi:dCTP deaminase
MGILIDTSLRARAGATPPELILNLAPTHLTEDIRGCAVDLHIGNIYRPGAEVGKPGSANSPYLLGTTLEEGETALVQTVESFKLDAQHAAFVFPVSSVSIQGLLMTNPGHVDPGYVGPLHVTVINMGRKPFALQPGGRFLRAVIHKLDASAASPKPPNSSGAAPAITQELLDKLSPDFLSVNQRTASAAKKEIDAAVQRSQYLQFGLPVITTIVGVALAAYFTNVSVSNRFEDRIKLLEAAKSMERLNILENNYPTEKRLLEIENNLKRQAATSPAPRSLRVRKEAK